MKLIPATARIIDEINGDKVLDKIELVARICYASDKGNKEKLIRSLIRNGHEAMLEHHSVSVLFEVDRGISHEIVRHRIASFAQESTRYCNYSKDKFGNEIKVIEPKALNLSEEVLADWLHSIAVAEDTYFFMIAKGCTPEQARSVLPTELATKLVMTANLREWRHFFQLRAAGATGKPHPQMLEVAVPLLKEFQKQIPIIFDDIQVKEEIA